MPIRRAGTRAIKIWAARKKAKQDQGGDILCVWRGTRAKGARINQTRQKIGC